MALTTQSVIGAFYYPDGDSIANAYVTFELVGGSVDVNDPATLPQAYIETSLNGSGELSVDLWPNERGLGFSYYKVRVTYTDKTTGKVTSKPAGNIQVPDSSGPHDIEDLLSEQIALIDDWGFIGQSVTIVDNWGSI